MKRVQWVDELRTTLGVAQRRRKARRIQRPATNHRQLCGFEILEERHLLAVDWGDAPDTAPGTGVGNYNTLSTDNGPSHTIVAGIRMGANVDGDGGALQNAAANADDVNAALPDDEDGVANPAADLVLTVGAQPTVNVWVTNTTGAAATLYGWIDYNNNGVFDNATERASVAVPNGTNNLIKTLVFPAVPSGFTGMTYARFRLSTDSAAANPTGAAADGEVEDYRVTITKPSDLIADSVKTKKIASGTTGAPTLANSDYFGRSVAAIGDVDGDGVTDLAVGANGDDTGGAGRGAVHVLLMNANGTIKSINKITSSQIGLANGDYFGSSLASLGDLDGDGVPDLVVGAERKDYGGTNRGAAYIVFLTPGGAVKNRSRISSYDGLSLSNGDYFGRSVAALGDLDGDGITDVAIGAYGDDTGGSSRGAIHVVSLNANGSVKIAQKIASGTGGGPALANGDQFGSSVASLGDIDGDGVTDLAVGAVGDDTGGSGRGAVHILFMNANGTVKSSQKIASDVGGGPTLVNDDQFGRSVAALGDVDGDGVTDLAVGAYYDDTGGSARGAVYVLLLNPNGTVKSSQKIASGTGGGPTLADDDRFGVSVSSLGDFDGDGLIDLVVGANFDDTGGTNRGAAYMLFLQALPTNTNPVITSPSTANVPENTTSVMTVTATDSDLPPQTITFSIVGGADQSKFSITAGGVLSFLAAPDYEAPTDDNGDNVYIVTVQASDGNGGTAEQTISVTVTPVNDSSPIFTSTDTASVSENTTTVKTVTATDADQPPQSITFSIVGGADQAKFNITSGGALSFAAAPNFEAPTDANGDNVYVVTVQASDGNGGTATQTISVTVLNENPLFTSPNSALVAENTTTVMNVTATGETAQGAVTLTFTSQPTPDLTGFTTYTATATSHVPGEIITGVDFYGLGADGSPTARGFFGPMNQLMAGPFTTVFKDFDPFLPLNGPLQDSRFLFVTTGSGAVNSPAGFNSETAASLRALFSRASGFGQAVPLAQLVIPNDAVGQLSYKGTFSVLRDGVNVTVPEITGTISPVTFSIVGGDDQSKFSITAGGALSFIAAPDFEAPTDANADNVYVVTVQANDGTGGTATQTIDVSVTPVNDNSPIFTSTNTASVVESTTAVKTVTATDADLPPQTITFSIFGGADQAKFGITPSGDLSFLAPPDFDNPTDANADNVYIVTVQASDGQGGTATQTISVTVTPPPSDYGDAPDAAAGTGPGNYNTRVVDNGPRHAINPLLRMGAAVDIDSGTLQNAAANADDVNGALPDDEDGLTNPAADLVLTVGSVPAVNVRVTNTSGSDATLYGWIDYNANGVFDNATERAAVAVPNGTNNLVKTLVFPTVPAGITGTTYARFRLSTDAAADNPTGPASDGEVEDYRVTIFERSTGLAESSKTKKIASNLGGLPGGTLANGDKFGSAIATIGDLDGDGVADVAVGAPSEFGSGRAGEVHIVFLNANGTVKGQQTIGSGLGGGPTLAPDDYFGHSVTALGDLDGDGITDLAVGASKDDTGGYLAGAVHVLFMNANGTVKSSQKIASGVGGGPTIPALERFGVSVTGPGDLDGDGLSDLAVGGGGVGTTGTFRGAVYVLFMNSNGTVKSSQKIAHNANGGPSLADNDGFGSSLASPGDVDGDGVSDLAVGTRMDDTGGPNRGAVHVLFMNSNGTAKATQKIASGTGGGPILADGDSFGIDVASLGDLDGDGVTDLVVGAYQDDTGGLGRGAVHVLFLNSNGTVKARQKIANGTGGGPTLANYDNFGSGIAGVGDVDGDGVVDLAVGAERDDTGGNSRGAVYVLFLKQAPFPGDYNLDNSVDAADYVMWRSTQGTSVTPFSGADGSGNGVIDQADYDLWRAHFGSVRPAPGAGSGASTTAVASAEFAAPQPAAAVEAVVAAAPTAVEPMTVDVQRPPALTIAPTPAAKPRTNQPRLPRGDRFAAAVSHDRALIAWLALGRHGGRREVAADDGDDGMDATDHRDIDDSDQPVDALDSAFASLGV